MIPLINSSFPININPIIEKQIDDGTAKLNKGKNHATDRNIFS